MPKYVGPQEGDVETREGDDDGENTLSGPPNFENTQEKESECEVEEQESAFQSQRPVRVRKPPDRYGEWVVRSLQHITNRLQMLEDKQIRDKDRIRKLKPRLLKKAKALRGH